MLKNTTIVVPLKYLCNFWRSLDTTLIYFKIELKLKDTNYCVLPVPVEDNANDRDDSVIFRIKDYMFVL